jgi:hypothetical protein
MHHGTFGNDRFGILAERDKLRDDAVQEHRDAEVAREQAYEERATEVLAHERVLDEQHLALLPQDTELTREVVRLTTELHTTICRPLDGVSER